LRWRIVAQKQEDAHRPIGQVEARWGHRRRGKRGADAKWVGFPIRNDEVTCAANASTSTIAATASCSRADFRGSPVSQSRSGRCFGRTIMPAHLCLAPSRGTKRKVYGPV